MNYLLLLLFFDIDLVPFIGNKNNKKVEKFKHKFKWV